MTTFSIGEAWSQAVAFLTENLRMLAFVVGGAMVIVAIIQYLVVGDQQALQMAALQSAVTSGDFSQLANPNNSAAAMGGTAILVGFVTGIFQTAAEFAGLRVGMTRGQEEVGPAFTYGTVAALLYMLFLIGAGAVGALAIGIPIGLIMVALGATSGGSSGGVAGVLILVFIAVLVILLVLFARLSAMRPAMAAARSTNPVFGLTESWRMTRGHTTMLVVYLLLLVVAAIVAAIVGMAIVGILGALLGPLVATILSTIVVFAPITIVSLAVGVGIYRTLAPRDTGDVFA